MRTKPLPPPFPVGARVVYPGPDWAHGLDPKPEAWTRAGDVGVVVEVHEGSEPTYLPLGDGEIDDRPFDGWSVVEFPNGNRRAAHGGDAGYQGRRYRLAR